MKLSKVKKICTDAGQLCVMDAPGKNNLVYQWVGTQDAMYPVEGLHVDREMLVKLWECSPKQAAAFEECPVLHDAELLQGLPGMIDTDKVNHLGLCEVMGKVAMKCGDGVIFIDPELLKPCGEFRNFVIVEDRTGPWVAVYAKGVLDGLVRPVSNDMANHLMACVRSVAKRDVVERVEE